MKNLTVATAVQNVELIDLKITEYKRRSIIARNKFKTASVENVDLRKCPEWVSAQTSIKELVDIKRTIIVDTKLFT